MNRFFLFALVFIACCSPFSKGFAQKTVTLTGQVKNQHNEALETIFISVEPGNKQQISDEQGEFTFELKSGRKYTLLFTGMTIKADTHSLFLVRDTTVTWVFQETIYDLDKVLVVSEKDQFGIRQLRATEDGGLYEGKKTEVINVEKMVSNKATNNARQTFAKIPSLNIWESDYAGLQLDIGGRGLDPKRTSNFNTRQNGYDISADALGYPESYYTPPLQAVEQIELVRGAGALQYGSQFGGMINFEMRRGDTRKPVNFESENSYGAYQFFNTFNAIHGQYKNLNHFSYVQYKRGDGWRPNSDFEQFNAFTSLKLQASDKLSVMLDYTFMHYLAQQAGGLTDQQFAEDPQQSTRSRNWFRVNWNIPALRLEYRITDDIKLYNRTFGLIARRTSLGLLTTPDEDDPEEPGEPFDNRDLIDGHFQNFGNETRLLIHYDTWKDQRNAILIGARYFKGFTNFSQAIGTDGTGPDFVKVDTAILDRRQSDFDFPSTNVALFAEKIIRLNKSLSLIPGIRYEYIYTEVDGTLFLTQKLNSFGDFNEIDSLYSTSDRRNILLYGLGLSQKIKNKFEIYANATANYRAINFSDLQIQTNARSVDPNIKDENGYSFDLGIRKLNFKPYFIEAGLFYIIYNDKIGDVPFEGLLRTNIGSGYIFGGELYLDVNIIQLFNIEAKKQKLNWFINGSVNHGVYTQINERASGVSTGNEIENIPDYNIKTGILYGFNPFTISIQGTFIGKQYSDARNNPVQIRADGRDNTGAQGPIPAYAVWDLSMDYVFSDHIAFSASVNNMLNEMYFTRRATGYPGPGIIPAVGRTWTLTAKVNF